MVVRDAVVPPGARQHLQPVQQRRADGDVRHVPAERPVHGLAGLEIGYPGGEFYRRNLTITVADCTGKDNGATELPILGFGCYFLLQEITQSGLVNEAFGQFVSECEASGRSGPTPGAGPGPTEIQLYKDPDSRDS